MLLLAVKTERPSWLREGVVESQVRNTDQRPVLEQEEAQLQGSGAFFCIQAGRYAAPGHRHPHQPPWPLSSETLPNHIQERAKERTLNDEAVKNISNSEVLQLCGASESPGGRVKTDCGGRPRASEPGVLGGARGPHLQQAGGLAEAALPGATRRCSHYLERMI